jgi:hypothetical protein
MVDTNTDRRKVNRQVLHDKRTTDIIQEIDQYRNKVNDKQIETKAIIYHILDTITGPNFADRI